MLFNDSIFFFSSHPAISCLDRKSFLHFEIQKSANLHHVIQCSHFLLAPNPTHGNRTYGFFPIPKSTKPPMSFSFVCFNPVPLHPTLAHCRQYFFSRTKKKSKSYTSLPHFKVFRDFSDNLPALPMLHLIIVLFSKSTPKLRSPHVR